MSIAIAIIFSIILILLGYVYACCYLNNVKWNSKETTVLKLTRNKIYYLLFAIVVLIVLMYLFERVYHLSLLQEIKLLSLVLIMLPIAAIDIRVQKIPNKLIIVALLLRCVLFVPEFIISSSNGFAVLKDSLFASIIITSFFFVFALCLKNSIGMGDIKLFGIIGLYQGVFGMINSVFYSLTVSFVLSVLLLISKKKSRNDTISFGPSIFLGTIIAIASAGM